MTARPPGQRAPRDGKGRFTKAGESYERDGEAMRLRSRGWTLTAIARELGYGDEANVRRALKTYTERVTGEAAAELRQAQVEQLDQLTKAAITVLEGRHLLFQQGKLCTIDGKDGQPVPVVDDAPVLRAVETLLRIQERRSRLLGLDAPTRAEIEQQIVKYTVDGVDITQLT